MGNAALLIKSSYTKKTGENGKWIAFQEGEIQPYIMGIETGFFPDKISAEVLNSLISGVPSTWARAKLFWFAFEYMNSQDANIQTSGLIDYFKVLIDEWKGLIALLALYQDRISFSDPVYMDPDNSELYDIPGAFGRMLQEDYDLWVNQEKYKSNPGEKPYLQLIYYKNQLIGCTSPFTIVFTGVDYSKLTNISDVSWYREGKFEDPMRYIQNDVNKIQKLFLFIKNIADQKIGEFEKNINLHRGTKPKLLLTGLKGFIRKWRDEIKTAWPNLKTTGPITKYLKVEFPFNRLLYSEQKVYVKKDGTLTLIDPGKENLDYEIRDLQTILNENNTIVAWYSSTDRRQSLESAPVYYLRVFNTNQQYFGQGKYLYFSLPLSIMGIKLFKNKIKALLEGSGKLSLEGSINEQNHLQVDLIVEIDNEAVKLNSKEYKIQMEDGNKKIILWPNFTSDNWTAYYLYNEYPTNAAKTKFIPFFKQKSNYKVGNVEKQGGLLEIDEVGIVYSDSKEHDKNDVNLKTDMIVTFPLGQPSDSIPEYEILESNKPFAGLEIRIEEKVAGYLVLKEGNEIIDRTNDDSTIVTATVGIDFGSNNTCAYYSVNDESVFPVSFSNRRIALVGFDNMYNSIAYNSELLFFQNEVGFRGQIKSWLHEHHPLAIKGRDLGDELVGGVPVNEKNILIERMDRYNIITQAGKLHYNMKWLSDEIGRQKKSAFLKTLWLQICADLYDDKTYRCIPNKLRWSYPGALSVFDKFQYSLIFKNQLPDITPISIKGNPITVHVDDPITESEAVCRYALGKQGSGLTENKLFLGIDIGGTTSDVLILAKVNDGKNIGFRLLKQSSIRVAAGAFFDAIISSARFRKELFDFHETKSKEFGLNILGIGDLLESGKKENAPFYLNSIFDQLKDKQFEAFYTFMGQKAQYIFTIPAYITGLLLYYAGKLVATSIKEGNDLSPISVVDLLVFGKGGRLFFWLDTFPGASTTFLYLNDCFQKGIGASDKGVKLTSRMDVRDDNKSEVAMGLVAAEISGLKMDETLRQTSDIFGEKKIKIAFNGKQVSFNEDDKLRPEYFLDPNSILFPDEFDNFNEFLDIFLDFVSARTNMVKNINSLKTKVPELKGYLTSYLRNDPEWKKAFDHYKEGQPFDYRFPFFIAEGIAYLNQVIIPEVFKI